MAPIITLIGSCDACEHSSARKGNDSRAHLGDGPEAEVHDVLVVRHASVPDLQHVRVCCGREAKQAIVQVRPGSGIISYSGREDEDDEERRRGRRN